MAVAMRRAHLGTDHAVRGVRYFLHIGSVDGLGEARPAGSGVELVGRSEQRLTRADVDVATRLPVVQILSGSGALSGAWLSYAILLLGKPRDSVGFFAERLQ